MNEEVVDNYRTLPGVKYKTKISNVVFGQVLQAENRGWNGSTDELASVEILALINSAYKKTANFNTKQFEEKEKKDKLINFVLSGTSATFSGNVSINANSARLTVSESGGAEVRVTAGGSSGFIGTYSNHSLTFLTNSTNALTIASTGAATFSSSVQAATESNFVGTSANTRILVTASGVANTVLGFMTDAANEAYNLEVISYYDEGTVFNTVRVQNPFTALSNRQDRSINVRVDYDWLTSLVNADLSSGSTPIFVVNWEYYDIRIKNSTGAIVSETIRIYPGEDICSKYTPIRFKFM